MDHVVEGLVEVLLAKLSSGASATAHKQRQYWVGIAGAPGSGKTTLTTRISDKLIQNGVECTVVPMDGYHYSRAELDAMPDSVSAHRFRGAPFTFNADAFLRDLRVARKQGEFSFPGFDHAASRIRVARKPSTCRQAAGLAIAKPRHDAVSGGKHVVLTGWIRW